MEQPQAKKKVPIPYAKDSQEYRDEVKRRLRENWAKKKEQYRPKVEEEEKGDAPPLPRNLPITWTIPDELHDVLGQSITLTDEWTKLPLYHVRRQDQLSKTTLQQYKTYYYRLPQKDIYDVVRFIKEQPLATRNMYAKAGLSFVAQDLWDSIYVKQKKGLASQALYKTKLQTLLIFSELSKRSKKEVYTRHASQETTDENLENTVEWGAWLELSKRYIKALTSKPNPTARDKQEALSAALYSYIPPVRLDWNDVEVRRTKGGATLAAKEGEKGKNILYLAAKEATVFWGEFKNSASFELPLKQVLPKELVAILHKTLPEGDGTPLKVSNYSTFLTGIAKQITGKDFSNRLMRSSYIRWWHDNNSKDGVDVAKTKAMMAQMHQTNMQVHLSYVKHGKLAPNDIDSASKTDAITSKEEADGTSGEAE
jgi:hypothetical protein